MRQAERRPAAPRLPLLSLQRWPVRWRLAGVSAALTFVILVVFAVVVGRLTSNRMTSDFHDDLRGTAAAIASTSRVSVDLLGGRTISISPEQIQELAPIPNSVFRIVYSNGDPIHGSPQTPNFGPPRVGDVVESGNFAVAAAPIVAAQSSTSPPVYVQYARTTAGLDDTIDRMWLFLALGVAGGTLLATLAGWAVATRAMRPIAGLTSAAREIAETRDPSRRVPRPIADDEVAELARTLDQMLRELDAARTETEQMMQMQREFVADASHELRTPLTSILANLELLQDPLGGPDDHGEEGEIVASALRSSRRMRRLVADLLLLARADAGRSGPRQPIDLAEVAAAAVEEVRPVANGHRLDLSAPERIEIVANADEIHRLALNLLDNGLRHTPPGSEIEIEVGRRNGDAVLEVRDDGPGLPPGLEDQVFARFARGEGPADRAADSGTGLGLAIVKAVAGSHGGEVEAGRSRGGGARFTVTLPLAGAPAAPAAAPARSDVANS